MNNSPGPQHPTPPAGEPATDRTLDVSTRSSRAMLCRAIENGWPIDTELKARAVEALTTALDKAVAAGRTRAVVSIARTLAVMHSQNQTTFMQAVKVAADAEARADGTADAEATIRVTFPTRGPQSSGEAR